MDPRTVDAIRSCELFQHAPESVLELIQPPPEWIEAGSGEILIRQDTARDEFYLLASGRLSVFIGAEVNEESHRVGEILPGQLVGEISMLTRKKATATVQVATDSRLVRFSFDSYNCFLQLIKQYPSFAFDFTRLIANRLLGQQSMAGQAPFRNVLLLPTDPDVDVRGFAASLQKNMEHLGKSTVIHATDLDADTLALLNRGERLDPEDIPRCNAKLLYLESGFDFVFYAIDNNSQRLNWAELTVGRANLVLLLARDRTDPTALTAFEQRTVAGMAPHLRPRTDLVLLHSSGTGSRAAGIQGAARWRAERHFQNVHHLTDQVDPHFERLARAIAGKSRGLALGGGGARAFAALGVIKALYEEGFTFDHVGGTSMGSFISALMASGMDPQQMLEATREAWVSQSPLSDIDVPLVAKIQGRKLGQVLESIWPGVDYEDLPIPCFAVSSDLGVGEVVIHSRGPVWAGVRASCSLPGIGPPMLWDGRYLVDGGVLNNMPTDVLIRRMDGVYDQLAAVKFTSDEVFNPPAQLEDYPTGWELLWSRVNPLSTPAPKVPRLFEILYRCATLANHQTELANYSTADLRFSPPIEVFGLLDFDRIDDIVEAGYQDALGNIRTYQEQQDSNA